ncbi:MAG: NADH-quinone oxidoreductase subunit NuoH [Ignavibacteriaceae bacterium]|nr:NADH-quinone oxidoreductase subunit NuoH [Ignavibacterium sp.]MCC6256074.1 NADH-quinone oxidoreductase subunit NuoH [Ignavibacteriaceae bacterium]HMN23678.1 NADH-quinone oxidoreductase subunit NuoH [Ignavibacteriaceae bacterium]HRN26859.1 NADH-quinone oxidoreductase subunit NuoH [Ignavibacteriaceae bacterium]HRP93916.1 NADH-quinone oxidoreductase subunit NuoH [Ignavibacteriaceae bacterium]
MDAILNFLWSIFSFYNFLLIRIVIVLVMILLTAAYLVYFERKISAWAQNRLGPNRVGWKGSLQSFADVFKLLFKEDIVPDVANKKIHTLAPMLALFVAFTTYAVIPIGPGITIAGYQIPMVIADVNIGILYVLALASLGVYAITFAGWSSGSKYSLLGGVRSSAQMISYEISMGFSIGGVVLLAESLRPMAIVESQSGWMWNIFVQPIGFITFLVAAFAETNRLPFDLPEAEPELVGGYHTEYSSMKFAAFFLAEYANMLIASTLIVTLYLGGWQIPYIEKLGLSSGLVLALQVAGFFVKVGALLFFFIWVRWSIPRFRYDQLMSLGWKVMFPLSLFNIIWVAILIMIFKL